MPNQYNPKRTWTDEDAAYAAAQWASGMRQREIGRIFGYQNGSFICVKVREFLLKYGTPSDLGMWSSPRAPSVKYLSNQGDGRKAAVKAAIAAFVERRAKNA